MDTLAQLIGVGGTCAVVISPAAHTTGLSTARITLQGHFIGVARLFPVVAENAGVSSFTVLIINVGGPVSKAAHGGRGVFLHGSCEARTR